MACVLVFSGGSYARKPPYQLSTEERAQYEQMMAAIERDNLEQVRALIKGGIDLRLREDSRASPTFMTQAAFLGQDDVLEALLSAGADMESLNGDSYTPLMCAVLGKRVSTVAFLIRRGANVNAQGWNGDTPLSLVAGSKESDIGKLLIAAGAKR